MEFGDFLNQMGSQTGTSLQLPNSEEIMQRHLAEETPPPPPPPKPVAPPQRPVEPKQEENELREDSIERVYEATAAIMKSIRKAFPNKAEQRLAYQSIYEAVGAVMGFSKVIDRSNRPTNPGRTYPTTPPVFREQADGSLEQAIPQGGFVPRQNDLEGATIDLSEYHQQVNESMATADGYTRAIDIKPNQGLTGVSQKDLDDLKTLAGIK